MYTNLKSMNIDEICNEIYNEILKRCGVHHDETINVVEDECSNAGIGSGIGFERIRRITGYLVGDVSKWNNAKRAELNDRSKHT